MIEVRQATTKVDFARCIQIRTRVFVGGQNVAPTLEVDRHEDESKHFLALVDGVSAGAGRWRRYEDGAKLERIAVLEEFRGRKIGAAVTRAMIEHIVLAGGAAWIKLGAQDHAIAFYEKLGFVIEGHGYEDAGIPHHDMVLRTRA
jgi:predicted GNAT family N-acyltransferase